MHMSEIWHSKKNDCRLSRTQVIIIELRSEKVRNVIRKVQPRLVSLGPVIITT